MERLKFFLARLREQLWLRPLIMCLFSIGLVFLAKLGDYTDIAELVPAISVETIETLLKIIAASMLVIATFAVGSMVSSYASASGSATPRSFSLVIADDVSQNALSSFVGSFIFSLVSLIALLSGLYDKGGRFVLFCLTLLTFAAVILTFVGWVDRIARLGRLGTTIEKAEDAVTKAVVARRRAPTLGGAKVDATGGAGEPVSSDEVGYVQRIEMSLLQAYAEELDVRFRVASLPGTYLLPGRPLVFVISKAAQAVRIDRQRISECFKIANNRTFQEDPRFGLIVLSEIASRALSPAVNDPGTAIDIINAFVRIFVQWNRPVDTDERMPLLHDRVEVPELDEHDLFDDAFKALARDGAGTVEVGVRLQKALIALASVGNEAMRSAAERQSRLALARSEAALSLPEDLHAVRAASGTIT
ncbi:DUF2254 domain-containing protein [Allohahella sp. A8]|uniref:DUF2254 domain-containing protein n=1 Tax=Allohahella sp. A8 TaxID=3141461 RepID=UPI003A804335